jgi:hypothetical protein
MAIETLTVAASDLEIRGGLQYIAIGKLSAVSAITFTDTADTAHGISAIGGLTSSNVALLFDLKQGTGSLSTSGSKDGGTIMFEHTVSFYVPNCSNQHFRALQTLNNENLVVVTEDYNGTNHCIGLSKAYKNADEITNQQMYARLSAVEGGTGAALGDENGVTVTITCSSGELPRLFTGTFNPAADGTIAIS